MQSGGYILILKNHEKLNHAKHYNFFLKKKENFF